MGNPFPEHTHNISMETAIRMTSLYRSRKEAILIDVLRDKAILPVSETFERSAFDRLLAQPGCEAIRIYYGMDEEQKLHAIIVAANKTDADILPTTETTGEIIEEGKVCPPVCAPASPLNSMING